MPEKERLSRGFVVWSECENSPGREKEGERKKRGSQGRSINKVGGGVRKGAEMANQKEKWAKKAVGEKGKGAKRVKTKDDGNESRTERGTTFCRGT